MHGVELNLRFDYEPLREHTAAMLEGLTGPASADPDIEVNACWRNGSPDPRLSFFDGSELDAYGKRMLLGRDRLVWPDLHRDKDLQLRFERRGRTLVFDVACWYNPSQKKLEKYPDYERKKYFDLLRYLVHFPIAWTLARRRGWVLVHASAVADGDRALLIAGPGGSGKTTTCVALAARAGLRIISENLIFWDGARVHPLCEPIRLTDESLELLGRDSGGLAPLAAAARLKYKSMYRAPAEAETTGRTPAAIFFPRFTRGGFVRPVAARIAAELLCTINRLTLELCDYDWWSSAPDLLWPRPGAAAQGPAAMAALASGASCWSLGIDRTEGVEAVVRRILECPTTGGRDGAMRLAAAGEKEAPE
jgi:hypothetical protein